jgi:hypothetical protein
VWLEAHTVGKEFIIGGLAFLDQQYTNLVVVKDLCHQSINQSITSTKYETDSVYTYLRLFELAQVLNQLWLLNGTNDSQLEIGWLAII